MAGVGIAGAPKCVCGEERDEEVVTLWAKSGLGLTAVHVHKVRACAEAARDELEVAVRGPVKFVPAPPVRLPGERASARAEGDPPAE